jgi:hypothetical protein
VTKLSLECVLATHRTVWRGFAEHDPDVRRVLPGQDVLPGEAIGKAFLRLL